MRTVHRFVAVFVAAFLIFMAATGIVIQLMDLPVLLKNAPATDPTQQAIRVGIDGPPNFQVIREPDYSADSLPAGFDFDQSLAVALQAGRTTLAGAPISFLEWRVVDGKPVAQLASVGQLYRFDAATGEALGAPSKVVLPPLSTPSLRNTVKDVHRFRVISQWALVIPVLVGASLCVMAVTGSMVYFRLLGSRMRLGRKNPFWFIGGAWRSLHRAIGVIAALFLIVIALSGMVLASSSLGVAVNTARHGGKRPGLTADVSSPLMDAELPGMLHTALASYRAANPGLSIRVLRLRYFGGMPQGVIVTGGDEARQVAFNAATGRTAKLYEPGYPDTDMPFGWHVTQLAKKIHRGDFIGMSGRWIALLSGFSLLYLSISGAVIYLELWNKRRERGRRELFWS